MLREPDSCLPTEGRLTAGQADKAAGLPEDVFEAVLAEQRREWMAGKRIRAGERLRQHPAAGCDRAQAAELIYHEFSLRHELSESPDWEEYLREFPEHAVTLRMWHQADRIVEQALAPEEPAICAPADLRDYELLEEIGHGGMGVVFKARQRSLDRIVALKMIRAGEYAGDEERKRFDREAQAVARLQHPNIVQIYEVGEVEGQPFLSLEFVDGQSLARRLNSTPLPPRQAASLLEVLARAMHYAHGKGVIHRDLKPSNVLLAGMPDTMPEGCTPKITDFGLAKKLDKGSDTGSGAVLGTPSYMAPEQAEAKTAQIDQRTDVYGLGTILYEMLTGRPPFRAESPLQTVKQVVEAEAARPGLLNSAVPRDLETVCLKCLEKEPQRRYPSAAALADDLTRWLRGEPVRARPVGPVGRVWRWCLRKPAVSGLAAALVLAVIGGFSASLVLWFRAEANLNREEAAHREAVANYARLREMVVENIHCSATHALSTPHVNRVREAMLHDAESCLSFFLQRRDEDPELRTLLADVLTQQGEILVRQNRSAEALAFLERAARIWEQLPPGEAGKRALRVGRAITCFYLEQVYEQQGHPDLAQRSFTIAFDLWRGLETETPNLTQEQYDPPGGWLDLSRLLILSGYSEKEVSRRFEEIRNRLDRMRGGPECELFFDLLRVQYLCAKAETYQNAQQSADVLAAAREAASVLARLLPRTSLHCNLRCYAAHSSFQVSRFLRREKASEEALCLSQQANRTLQELLHEAPNDHFLLHTMSISWHEIGKIHWVLHQTEETLTACQKALEAQRKLFLLTPTVPEVRRVLGLRYVELGRKLCELGRLDEAESCFRERQGLWSGDAAKREEALREVQKWAAQVGEDKKDLSPEEQQERQRYLDLCIRLERKRVAAARAIGSEKP